MNNFALIRTFLIGLFFGIGLWIQNHIIISGDITWLMQVGQRLLNGGRYFQDFIEVNPPMCIYIYLLPVIVSKWLHVSFISSLIFYIFTLTSLILLFCHHLLKIIIPSTHTTFRYSFEIALAFIFYLLPTYAFGQREYLLVVLFVPYLLIAVARIQQQTIKPIIATTAGIIAAIGFAQKPFFIPTWLLIETYVFFKLRTWHSLFRTEALACMSVFIIYAISIWLITPEYITKVVPFVSPIYYQNFRLPFLLLLTSPSFIFSIILMVAYLFSRNNCSYQALLDLLALTLIGAIFIFLVQGTLWLYHYLPILMLYTLLITIICNELLTHNNPFTLTQFNWQLGKTLGICFVLFILIGLPISAVIGGLNAGQQLTNRVVNNKIFQLAKKIPKQPIYFFTYNISIIYPFVDYTQTYSVSHLPGLWPISAASLLAKDKSPAKQQLAKNIANYTRTIEINNIIQTPPVYIFVQKFNSIWVINKINLFDLNSFSVLKKPSWEFLTFFRQDPRFNQFFMNNYQYWGEDGQFVIYRLKKIKNSAASGRV